MKVTVADVMRHVREFFPVGWRDGMWQITQGVLSPEVVLPNEWVGIGGPDGPVGVYLVDPKGTLPLEGDWTWEGRVWRLNPPEDFLRVCKEIAQWAEQNHDPAVVSEHFGAYSRTQTSGGWQEAFSEALRPYMRMYTEVDC